MPSVVSSPVCGPEAQWRAWISFCFPATNAGGTSKNALFTEATAN